ncbi:hypothetical protein BpHYR1_043594, partial [Brachionus plicatilis]
IATLNVGGIETNQHYINKLLLEHDILCLQEMWLEDLSKQNNLIFVNDKIILANKARRISTKGRSSGGLAFDQLIMIMNFKMPFNFYFQSKINK